jgi:hypothetical protein
MVALSFAIFLFLFFGGWRPRAEGIANGLVTNTVSGEGMVFQSRKISGMYSGISGGGSAIDRHAGADLAGIHWNHQKSLVPGFDHAGVTGKI